MNPALQMLGPGDAVLWFGIFAASLLSLTVLVRIRDNPAANLWLLVFLLASLGGIFLKFVDHHGLLTRLPHLYRINHPVGLCRPVALYLYLWYILNPHTPARRRDVLHFVPALVVIVYLWPVYTLGSAAKLEVVDGIRYVSRAHLPSWYPIAGALYSLAYWGLSVRAYLASALHRDGQRNRKDRRLRNWVVAFLVGGLVFMILVVTSLVAGGGPTLSYLLFQYLSVLVVLACLALLLSARSMVAGEAPPRYERSTLTSAEKTAHAEAINRLFEVEEIHRRSGLRLRDLSEKLGVPEYVLSQVINEEFKISFTDLVNHHRVEAAKRLLADNEYADYSIEGIGREVGFRSRASFYTTFKRMSGDTPARFRDALTD